MFIFLSGSNSGLKYKIWRVNSLAVQKQQFQMELLKSSLQKIDLKYQI